MRLLLSICLLTSPLWGAPSESIALQDMRLGLEQLSGQMHRHEVEVDLFQERLQKLEKKITTSSQENPTLSTEKRLLALEKANEALMHDFKTLKQNLNETLQTITQSSNEIKSLKKSLHSILTFLQSPDENSNQYTVRPGDSLSQIALDHKTTTKMLKELNSLKSDTIYTGQKLALP